MPTEKRRRHKLNRLRRQAEVGFKTAHGKEAVDATEILEWVLFRQDEDRPVGPLADEAEVHMATLQIRYEQLRRVFANISTVVEERYERGDLEFKMSQELIAYQRELDAADKRVKELEQTLEFHEAGNPNHIPRR